MLPILPVLLILLFQGPANIERMALEGRLPAALRAIERMDAPQSEREALASLLAASKDPELTQALFTLLKWVEAPATPHAMVAIPAEPEQRVPIPTWQAMSIQDGFQASQRSRDGPLSDC